MTDLVCRIGTLGRTTIPASGIVGTSGVWTNVTPAGINLTASYSQDHGFPNTDDNFGVQDVLADPVHPGVFYAFVCYQGVWKSSDWGLTWAKVSTSAWMDTGKNWGADIAVDGSYMLCVSGNAGDTLGGGVETDLTVMKSTDGGITWPKANVFTGPDRPYNVECSPYSTTRAISGQHDTNNFWESIDSGATWTNMGAINVGITFAPYVHYLEDSDHILVHGIDVDNCYLGTKSGGSWTYAQITDLASAGHQHGGSQMYRDATTGFYFLPCGQGTNPGIYKSTNQGRNWTRVFSANDETALIGTPSTLYCGRGAAQNAGTFDPFITTSAASTGTSWPTPGTPTSGMINGPKRWAKATDGNRWVLVTGNWHAGIWRYIE